MNNSKHPFLRIAAICAILAPLALLTGDLLMMAGRPFEFSIGLWLAFVFFVPAIFAVAYLSYSSGSRLALVGGACAFFGAMAGASMQILFRVYAVLDEAGNAQAIELLRSTMKLIATTQMIGIFFPIGLIMLAISLFGRRLFHPLMPLLLIGAAVAFPVGRIIGLAAAVFTSDVLLLAAFGLIGWRMLTGERETSPAFEENFAGAQK